MKRRLVLPIAIVAACAFPVVAQNGPGGADTLSALLVEVRALGVAMERAASSAPQIQLLAARLTVQNERLARISRTADDVHQELERMQSEGAALASRAAQVEDCLTRESDPARVRDLKSEQSGIRAQLEERAALEPRLRARDADLANQAAAEQGQWIELNRRFDELERELAARRPQ